MADLQRNEVRTIAPQMTPKKALELNGQQNAGLDNFRAGLKEKRTARKFDVTLDDKNEGTRLTINGGNFNKVKEGEKPVIITSGNPVNENDIVLIDNGAGQKVVDFKIMLMWNPDGFFEVWNRGEKPITVMDSFGQTQTKSIPKDGAYRYIVGDRIQIGDHTVAVNPRGMNKDVPEVEIALARSKSLGNNPVGWN